MKTTTLAAGNTLLLPLLLGIVVIIITNATLAGKQLPFVSSPRAALVALLVVGMAMCALGGIGQVGASGRWVSPLAIPGYLIGVTLLVVIMAGLAGWDLPLIHGEEDAVLATTALIGVKTLIGTLGYFFHLL